jgi:hypothetical protein
MNFTKIDYVNAKRLLIGTSPTIGSSNHHNDKRLLMACSDSLQKACITKTELGLSNSLIGKNSVQ